MYAISRIEAKPGIWCWSVNFRRRGKPHYKSFYDLQLGGSKKALAAAVEWRDSKLTKTHALSKREFHQLVRTNNQSGVAGVQFICPSRQPLGSWQARLKLPDGKELTRTFAVKRYGYDEAFRLAVDARQELLETIEDNRGQALSSAPDCQEI
ncbi:MAG: AP2 domain-containing protein [Rhodocyclaceae bacterium]|nr:AP2 domain-containing protein [Rhodocyclaceae bacterium]